MKFIRGQDVNLAEYLPAFVSKDKEIKTLLSVESEEHNRQRELLIDMLKQFFIHSATWGLDCWERALGITSQHGAGKDMRRRKILRKLQGKQISTVSFMEKLAARYFSPDVKVCIKEIPKQNTFRVICDEISRDYPGLIEAIEEYKPAHLAFALDYLMERETQIFVAGYAAEFEVIDIPISNEISYRMDGLPFYAAGRVDSFEIIDIRSA